MTTLATKSKHKKTLLTASVFFFAALAFLYLNSFIQDHIIISLICFIFMLLFMAFTGILLFKHSKLPEVLAEYDKDTLYLFGDVIDRGDMFAMHDLVAAIFDELNNNWIGVRK